ncbi:DMT family transporter [Candidatus Avelusimicrobium luingense]|uniref:DMT family transporter n=1 Tax=Candidatus Avelusimicrobium luingense TaxID=3416211 RepID=UPI003D112C91
MSKLSPLVAIWISCVCTAINVVISKMATPYVTSALFLLGACFSACVFLSFHLGKSGWKRILAPDVRWKGLGMGTFGTALTMTVFMIALNYTTPVNSAVDNQFEIIYSLILSAIILKERPTVKQIGGSLFILLGVILIVLKGGYTQAKGDFLILGSLWMFQVSHIFAKKLPAGLTAPQIAAARAFYAMPALIILLIALYFIQGPFLFVGNATLWGTLLGSAVINYVAGNILWYHAIRNMDLSKATAIILCYPVFTFILSVAIGQDTLSMYKIVGMALAVGGAYMVTSSAKKQQGANA